MILKIMSCTCNFFIEYFTNNTLQMLITICSLLIKIIFNNIYETKISILSLFFKYFTNNMLQMMFLIFSLCIKNFINNIFQILFLIYNVVIIKHICLVINFLKFSIHFCSKISRRSLYGSSNILNEQLKTKSSNDENKNQASIYYKKQILKKFLLCSEANNKVDESIIFSNIDFIQNDSLSNIENNINSLSENNCMPITAIQVAIEEKPLTQINYNHETIEPQVYNPKYSNDEKETQLKDTLKNKILHLKAYLKNKTASYSYKINNITDIYHSMKLISWNFVFKSYNRIFKLHFKKYKFSFIKLIRVVIELTKEERLPQVFQHEIICKKDATPKAYCTNNQIQKVFHQKTITPQVSQIQEVDVTQIQKEYVTQIQEGHVYHPQEWDIHIQKEISYNVNNMESNIKKGIFT